MVGDSQSPDRAHPASQDRAGGLRPEPLRVSAKGAHPLRGRLAASPGFTPKPWRGLGTAEMRTYLLQSLACQPNPDRERAIRLLYGWALRKIANGCAPRDMAPHQSKCQHDRFYYEDCERCIEEYASRIIACAGEAA